MVKKADVEKCKREIALLSEHMGVPLFQYDEIHKPVNGQVSNYDFNKVIDDFARYHDGVIKEAVSSATWQEAREKAKQQLIDMGVLVPATNGEFAVRFDDKVRVDSDAQTKNGCVFANSLKKATVEDVQEIYQEFAVASIKKPGFFFSEVMDDVYEKYGMDKSLQKQEDVKDYKEYLESSFGAAYAYAHTLALTGKGSMKLAKRSGFGALTRDANMSGPMALLPEGLQNRFAKGCNDEILKEIKRVVTDARREGTLRGYATQGWRWLKAKVTGKEDDRFSVAKSDLFDQNGNIKVDALRILTKEIVKDKAQDPMTFAFDLEKGRDKEAERKRFEANFPLFKAINAIGAKGRAFKKWRSRNSLFSKDARLDKKLKKDLKRAIKSKITATQDNGKAVQSMEKVLQGMQLLTLQTGMDPLSGELLKTMLKREMESGNLFGKQSRADFADEFIKAQKDLGKDTISKGDLKQFLKTVEKVVAQNLDNPDFKKLVTYMDRPYNEVKQAMDTALGDHDNFVSAELVPTNRVSPLMGASYEQTLVFIMAGMDVTQQDAAGKTALHYAKDSRVVDLLCNVCPELVDVKDNQGRTAVHDARSEDVLRGLKRNGANLSAPDNNGQTLAHLASDYEIIKALADYGADLTAVDNKGNTPLMTNISLGKMTAISEHFGYNAHYQEKSEFFNHKNNDGMSALDLIVSDHDMNYQQKKKMLGGLTAVGVIDHHGALKHAKDGNDVNAVMDAFVYLPPEAKKELVSDALMGKITPSKIEAIAKVCDENGIERKDVFDFKDKEGKTPIVNVLQSDMSKEQKLAVSQLLVQNGADFKVATDYIKQEQEKQRQEEKKKQEEEKKKQEEKGKEEQKKEEANKDEPAPTKEEPNKDELAPTKDEPKKEEPAPTKDETTKDEPAAEPKKRDLGEVFAEHPELSTVYAGLIANRSSEQIKAINEAFQSIEPAKDKANGEKTAIEDKVFTSLINSNAFNDKEKEVLFEKLVKAEEKRTGQQVLPGGVRVESIVDKKNKDEIIKFGYRDGSSIEFSKKDMSVTRKYKDEKGEVKEITLKGNQAQKLQADLMKIKGLGAQGRALPKLFEEAQKVKDNTKVDDKGLGAKVINQMQSSIGK